MEEAIGNKIADYLIKPVNPNQILLSLKKNLDHSRLVSEKTTSNYQQEFRKIAINDAAAAIKQIAGHADVLGVEVQFVDETKLQRPEAVIVLPDSMAEMELSLEEIETAAGGAWKGVSCKSNSCNDDSKGQVKGKGKGKKNPKEKPI